MRSLIRLYCVLVPTSLAVGCSSGEPGVSAPVDATAGDVEDASDTRPDCGRDAYWSDEYDACLIPGGPGVDGGL